MQTFSKKLLHWYHQHGRHDLPWQKNPTAYRVWISEIMLQQTQVATVIPYYTRFMQSFPNVKTLSLAKEDDVLSHWSGLGYYARARNIYKTAQLISEKYHGKFPTNVDDLCQLPGIGKSTAGAIISFSLQKKAVILDGNVKRVLARFFAIDQPVNQKNTMDEMWILAEKLTPDNNAHEHNQAIMDLGATLCTRSKPRCSDCPLIRDCKAHSENKSTFYPVKTIKKTRPVKQTTMLIIQNKQGEMLLVKRRSTGIWGGLWSFPENGDQALAIGDRPLTLLRELPAITHQFTHFTLIITPQLFTISKKIAAPDLFWYKLGDDLPGGIPAPVEKILRELP